VRYRRKKFTFAISSPDEFLLVVAVFRENVGDRHSHSARRTHCHSNSDRLRSCHLDTQKTVSRLHTVTLKQSVDYTR